MKRVFAWAAAHLVAACYLLALALWALWALGNAGWDALGFATGRLTTVEVPLSFAFGLLTDFYDWLIPAFSLAGFCVHL